MLFRYISFFILAFVLGLVSASPIILPNSQAPSAQAEKLLPQVANMPLLLEITTARDEHLVSASSNPNHTSSLVTEQTSAKVEDSFINGLFQKFTGRTTAHVVVSHSTAVVTAPIRRRFSARVARRRHPVRRTNWLVMTDFLTELGPLSPVNYRNLTSLIIDDKPDEDDRFSY